MGKEATIHLQESLEKDQSTPSKRTEIVSEVNKEKGVNFSWFLCLALEWQLLIKVIYQK